jgi:hypothetical protein
MSMVAAPDAASSCKMTQFVGVDVVEHVEPADVILPMAGVPVCAAANCSKAESRRSAADQEIEGDIEQQRQLESGEFHHGLFSIGKRDYL